MNGSTKRDLHEDCEVLGILREIDFFGVLAASSEIRSGTASRKREDLAEVALALGPGTDYQRFDGAFQAVSELEFATIMRLCKNLHEWDKDGQAGGEKKTQEDLSCRI